MFKVLGVGQILQRDLFASGFARIPGTQIDVSSDDEPLIRLISGRHVVPRMGERSRRVALQPICRLGGEHSAIVVGPQRSSQHFGSLIGSYPFHSASSIWRISRAQGVLARQCRAHINRHEHLTDFAETDLRFSMVCQGSKSFHTVQWVKVFLGRTSGVDQHGVSVVRPSEHILCNTESMGEVEARPRGGEFQVHRDVQGAKISRAGSD